MNLFSCLRLTGVGYSCIDAVPASGVLRWSAENFSLANGLSALISVYGSLTVSSRAHRATRAAYRHGRGAWLT